jgi:hypothetical protein
MARAYTRRLKSGKIVHVRASFSGSPNRKAGDLSKAIHDMSRPGLEGPFHYRSGWSGYYDPKIGRYYDHRTDMYQPRDFDPHTGRGML